MRYEDYWDADNDNLPAERPPLWDRDTVLCALWHLAWSALGLLLIAILLGDISL